jgi:hypothetical protein
MVREEQFNSFQIIRPVLDTPRLRKFLEASKHAGLIAFGARDRVSIERETEDAENEDSGTTLDFVGLSPFNAYPSWGLKLALLDRRTPVNLRAQPLYRSYQRFLPRAPLVDGNISGKKNRQHSVKPSAMPSEELVRSALAHDLPNPQLLDINFTRLTYVNDPDYSSRGRELALEPDLAQPETLEIYDEASICFNALYRQNPNLAYPTMKSTLNVPFGRLPAEASDYQIARFVQLLEPVIDRGIQLTLAVPGPKFNS